MIDMGMHKGQQTFYVPGDRTWGDLLQSGEIVALPDGNFVCFKRRERCSPLELQAAYTWQEIQENYPRWTELTKGTDNAD